MGVSGNTSKVSSVVAALCILVYIAAIAFGTTRIVMDIRERRNMAHNEFSDLLDRASSSAVFLGFMSEAYQDSIRDFIGLSHTLLGIIITSATNEYAFERQPGSGIVWTGRSPRLRVGFGISSDSLNLPLRIEGQRNVTVRAAYSFIDFGFFQSVLRDTLLAVLGALIIAFATLLVEFSIRKKPGHSKSETADIPLEPFSQGFKPVEIPTFAANESKMSSKSTEEGNPQGLYSPRSNIGWESYTHDRLASELHRCSSFEQDLTFVVMEFRENIPMYRQFADETVNFFYMKDLIFEQGTNGISIILPNMGLEQGIAKCEEFRSLLISKLPETFEGRSGLCIGLTSRAGRLVDAKRLMLEAFSALDKAIEDEVSSVVAFKSDPEKYREFVKQNVSGD